MSDDRIITIEDLRKVFCINGMRKWAAERGLDFRSFVKNGITVDEFASFGEDAYLEQVLKIKHEASK